MMPASKHIPAETCSATLPAGSQAAGYPSQACLLGSRQWDFWLLGGLSIVCWVPFFLFVDYSEPLKSFGTDMLPWIAFYLAYLVNYPHFMASYKLAYGQGRAFVSANWFQLIAVPTGLILISVVAYLFWDTSIKDSSLVTALNRFFSSVGLQTRVGLYPNLGSEALGLLIHLLYFTVGWHYAKQTFGCMMVYARLDNYRLSTLERNLVRYSLLSTWWLTWLYSNCSVGSYNFYELEIHRLGLPYVWYQTVYVAVALLYAGVLVMLLRKYLVEGVRPSAIFLIPMVALVIWHVPLFENPEYFVMIAFFHSLQYFPFVAKVERARYERDGHAAPQKRLGLFFLLMIAAGYLAFDLIPDSLDTLTGSVDRFQVSFFIIAFMAFINIHHYFIDNVLWRFKNKEVRELLLR